MKAPDLARVDPLRGRGSRCLRRVAARRVAKWSILVALSGVLTSHATEAFAAACRGARCTYVRVSVIGRANPARLASLGGVAFDAQDRVYVADTRHNQVAVFGANGGLVQRFGGPGSGPGRFERPDGIAVARDGSIAVADTNNDRIQLFTGSGGFVHAWNVPRVAKLAIAEDGTIWALHNRFNSADQLASDYKPDGTLIREWTIHDISGDGIAASADRVLITGSKSICGGDVCVGHRELRGFATDGTLLWTAACPSFGLAPPPPGTASCGHGQVVATPDDTSLSTDGPGLLTHLDRDGNLINRRVVATSAASASTSGLALSASGRLAITNGPGTQVRVYSPGSSLPVSIVGSTHDAEGQLNFPAAAAVAADHSLFVADSQNFRIQHFDPHGRWLSGWQLGSPGGAGTTTPQQIAIDRHGHVLVAIQQEIDVFSPRGRRIRTIKLMDPSQKLAVSSAGVVLDAGYQGVYGYTTTGRLLFRHALPPQFNFLVSMTAGPGGQIYLVDQGSGFRGALDVLSPTGRLLRRIAAPDPANAITTPDGTILVNGSLSLPPAQPRPYVLQLSPSGTVTRVAAGNRGLGQLAGLTLLAADRLATRDVTYVFNPSTLRIEGYSLAKQGG